MVPVIPGVDTSVGVAKTGGTEAGYRKVLSMFCRDTQERLKILQTMPDVNTLSQFTTQVHSLKSTLATIGVAELSGKAAELEIAAKAGNYEVIHEKLALFTEQMPPLVSKIQEALASWDIDNFKVENTALDISQLELFRELAAALKSMNVIEVDRIIEKLNQEKLGIKGIELLGEVSCDILSADYDKARWSIANFLNQ